MQYYYIIGSPRVHVFMCVCAFTFVCECVRICKSILKGVQVNLIV